MKSAVKNKKDELQRLKAKRGHAQWAGYFPILLVLLSFIYIIDEVASNMKTSMQTEVVHNLFELGMGLSYNEGLSRLNLMLVPASFLVFVLPFYKSLADKYGRKVFLIFNTLGMGFGLFLCFISQNIYIYVAGCSVVSFFQPNDIQVLYVAETVPPKHRAKVTALTKAIGMFGVSVIPLLRAAFMGDNALLWKNVFIVPIVGALIVSLISLFFVAETPVYLKKRIDELEKDIAKEDGTLAEEAQEKKEKTGVLQAIKFISKNKQLRNIALCGLLFSMSMSITTYYVAIMTDAGVTTEGITQALFMYPIFNAIMTGVSGFISDKFGRKHATIILGITAFTALLLFVLSSSWGISPMVLGALYGIFSGCFWSVSDIMLLLIPSESTPTHLRASVVGTLSVITLLGAILSGVVVAIGLMFTESIGLLCFGFCAPFVVAAIALLQFKVRETKGVNLDTITGTETN